LCAFIASAKWQQAVTAIKHSEQILLPAGVVILQLFGDPELNHRLAGNAPVFSSDRKLDGVSPIAYNKNAAYRLY
jgi:hypothetical protein